MFRSGKRGGKPDALTRINADRPTDSIDERNQYQFQTLLKPQQILRCMSSSHSTITGLFEDTPGQIPSFENWKESCEKDKFCQEIRVALNDQTASRNDIELASCVITEHSFNFNEREYIPETLRETILN